MSAPAPILCGRCGYDVRGLPSRVCPECGGDLSVVGVRRSDERRFVPPLVSKSLLLLLACVLIIVAGNLLAGLLPMTFAESRKTVVRIERGDDVLRVFVEQQGNATFFSSMVQARPATIWGNDYMGVLPPPGVGGTRDSADALIAQEQTKNHPGLPPAPPATPPEVRLWLQRQDAAEFADDPAVTQFLADRLIELRAEPVQAVWLQGALNNVSSFRSSGSGGSGYLIAKDLTADTSETTTSNGQTAWFSVMVGFAVPIIIAILIVRPILRKLDAPSEVVGYRH